MDEEKYMSKEDASCSLDNFVKDRVMPYLKDLGVVLCAVLILFLFFFRIAVVDGSSMKNTLLDGDLVLLVNSLVSGQPEYGDIVVINKASYGVPIIKRVIATQGQTVTIDSHTGTVKVDDVVLDEKMYISTQTAVDGYDTYSCVVEDGCIFVMGDNRGSSKDSRSTEIGMIDCREIVGKAVFLISPGTDKGNQKRDFTRIGVLN